MHADDFPGAELPDPLIACRRRLDRLRREAVAELGPQPMIPEKFSMLAMMLASVPLVLLVQLDLPGRFAALEVGLALPSVWLAAFLYQRARYDRFQARCDRRLQRALAEPELPEADGFLIFR
jgi:hypothetical protein